MADEQGPAFVSFAGGAFSGRVESTMRESAQQTFWNLVSIDAGGAFTVGAGATIGASQITQATGYQIQAAMTQFNTVTPAPAGAGLTPTAAAVLPQTNRPFPFTGLLLYIINNGANPINVYPSPNDPSNSINGLSTNSPVILGTNTITAFTTVTPGIWWADGIGEGQMGSIATTVSQGNITAAGTSIGTATLITQAMFTTSSISGWLLLPNAIAGLTIVGNFPNGTAGTVTVGVQSGQSMNGTTNGTYVATTPQTAPTVFYAFTAGAWYTK